jgi:3',5'-cyclic AMP phosphodiesterase CpdA
VPDVVSAIHLSDLHRGKRESQAADEALRVLAARLSPQLVIASGDLASLGRVGELERARALLSGLAPETLVVPGNHDIPYTFPGRFTHPWRSFERVFGTVEPVLRTPSVVAVGLNSVRPWRQQGGRLPDRALGLAAEAFGDAPPGALRLVACHHHLVWAPWRGLHKLPLKQRDRVLGGLVAAGAEIVCAGHIHQATAVERRDVVALDGPAAGPLVLTTAPGYGRPRPRRTGEAQGLHVLEWTPEMIAVVTHVWDGAGFVATGRREFPRTTTL